jgi:secreted trypsin-like serine protease
MGSVAVTVNTCARIPAETDLPLDDEVTESTTDEIVGGTEVPANQRRWQAAIFQPADWTRSGSELPFDRFMCGATVIDAARGIVMTAAHCVAIGLAVNEQCDWAPCEEGETAAISASLPAKFFHVAVTNGRLTDLTDADLLPVLEVITHPGYDETTLIDDIALLRVEGIDPRTPTPRLLGSRSYDPWLVFHGRTATVSGWGRLSEDSSKRPDRLNWVNVPVVDHELCRSLMEDETFDQVITDSMLCAGPLRGGRDACSGDSGGPLTVRDLDGRPVLSGVVSWGDGCAAPQKPGVYTSVLAMHGWITSCLSPDMSCDRLIEIPEDQL